jgi:hypothetical protein
VEGNGGALAVLTFLGLNGIEGMDPAGKGGGPPRTGSVPVIGGTAAPVDEEEGDL